MPFPARRTSAADVNIRLRPLPVPEGADLLCRSRLRGKGPPVIFPELALSKRNSLDAYFIARDSDLRRALSGENKGEPDEDDAYDRYEHEPG